MNLDINDKQMRIPVQSAIRILKRGYPSTSLEVIKKMVGRASFVDTNRRNIVHVVRVMDIERIGTQIQELERNMTSVCAFLGI